jgi:Cu2+-exporting ATPase
MDVNYVTQRARVRWIPAARNSPAVLKAVVALGYAAYPCDTAAASGARRGERDRALMRLFVAGLGMMQVMMYLIPMYLTAGEMTADIEQLMRLVSMILTLPVVCYSAMPFFTGAWRDLRARHLGMDVPWRSVSARRLQRASSLR